jgi:hypothetical protein
MMVIKHTIMRFTYFLALLSLLAIAGCDSEDKKVELPPNEWTTMLDADLSKWEKFIGVPHFSITTLPGYPKGDGMVGTPIGLGKDPLNVFSTKMVGRDVQLYISGEIYGGLTTVQEYENYHLKLEFKWGEKKYEPRLAEKRDNGILYHCYGNHGAFWNVWMNSQEFQVQEADMGDYFALGPGMDVKAENLEVDGVQAWIYRAQATPQFFGDGGVAGRCRRGSNAEKPHGEWNTFELICVGQKAVHVVNDKVVMVLNNSRKKDANGQWQPLTKGRIQIQCEGAECWYRNIQIRPVTEVPAPYNIE